MIGVAKKELRGIPQNSTVYAFLDVKADSTESAVGQVDCINARAFAWGLPSDLYYSNRTWVSKDDVEIAKVVVWGWRNLGKKWKREGTYC